MFIKSGILCGLIAFYAAYAAPTSYLITLRNFTHTRCPLYESLLLKSPVLDQCPDKRPSQSHLGWEDRDVILCLMYSTVFEHFCKGTNLTPYYESAGLNLTNELQKASLTLDTVCNSLQHISLLATDVVKMFTDATKCQWLCSNFNTGMVDSVCSLTSVMWELTKKDIKETTIEKVSQQEATNSRETIISPSVNSKPSSKPSVHAEVNQDKPSTEANVNKIKASIETNVNENKGSIHADVKPKKDSTDADVNQQHSPKESAIDTETGHAYQTNGDKPTIVSHADDNSKGSIQVSQAGDASTPSKDMITPKDKKNSQQVTAHGNSGPAIVPEDAQPGPDKPNPSDTKNIDVSINPVITGKTSDPNKGPNENTKPKTKSDTQKSPKTQEEQKIKSDVENVPKHQEEHNLGVVGVGGKVNLEDTPVEAKPESKQKVIPSVINESIPSQVDEQKKIEDIPDTKGDDINIDGDLDDEDPKYEGGDNDEPPLLQKTTNGKGDNAQEVGDEPPSPKYGEVKNKVDVIKPKEIDEDNLNIAANFQNQNIDDSDSYFFSYFMMVCVVFIFGYVAYHNKQKILALVLEGRRGRRPSRTRRPNSSNYRKLDSTLEEAVTSSCNKNSTQVIY
ncbi:trans-Golgi network integral membrane protein 2-like [Photinus pyralis]|uniref:trans-Golgi network integral membrane protein 2-like n=1 Tax=Photinus pyralis TaxID=7054 RepID=UPI00126706FE|nr:trans-Golgi network integral membrane protein 2-like [Photinus pyralis]